MKRGVSFSKFEGKSTETETTTWSELPNGGKATVEQILGLAKRKKSKSAGLWESLSEVQVRRLMIGVRSSEIEKL